MGQFFQNTLVDHIGVCTDTNNSHYSHSLSETAIHETVFVNYISYNTFVSLNKENVHSLATLVRVIFIIQLKQVL